MSEFTPCEACNPEKAKQCRALRELVGRIEPCLSSLEDHQGERVEAYARRLAAHHLAVRLIERDAASCTEFAPEVQALHVEPDSQALPSAS